MTVRGTAAILWCVCDAIEAVNGVRGRADRPMAGRRGVALELQAARRRQAQDNYVATVVHELRTPLSHIKGFVSALRQRDVTWDEGTRADFLAEVEREADRLAGLIGDLLDLSRAERAGPDRAAVAPAALVAGALDRVRGPLAGRPVAVEVPADLPALWADAPQLERVLANLLENAAKYTPAGSPVGLAARARPGRRLELAVEDRGPGIAPELLDRVFDRFFRAPGPEAAAAGSGLGLALARSIVQAHGGRIRAENRPGGGARFVLTLRLAPPPPHRTCAPERRLTAASRA